jgi:two-component system cell cycle response regulator
VSLRARLALVLAVVLVGPVVAAGMIVAVVVPGARADAEAATLRQSAGVISAYLAQRCARLGTAARAAALDLSAGLALAGPSDGAVPDAARARGVVDAAVRDDVAGEQLLVTVGERVVASSRSANPPDPRALLLASCSRGDAPAIGVPAQVETVPVTNEGGTEVARVVAVAPLDDAALAALRARLGLSTGLALSAAGTRVASAGSGAPRDVRERTSGVAAGQRVLVVRAAAGLPYDLVVWTSSSSLALPVVLTLVALAALLACGVLLLVVTTRLTRPLRGLTTAAERLRSGDLTARNDVALRTGDPGSGDEVDRLAAAIDALAARLQGDAEELQVGREALAETAERLGHALARTHDLEGLLQTVLDAVRDAADAEAGAAFLGEARALEERAVTTRGGGPPSPAVLDGLARLARGAVERDTTARGTVPVNAPSPGIAVPLRSCSRMLGALALVRREGAPPVDAAAVAAVEALAASAGIAVGNVLEHEETRRLSVTDALTGAGNFRHLSTTLAREVERATRFSRPLSIVMFDLDHFKSVNDTHGHAFGDGVLREFARRLQDCLREVDTVARYGGEEFAVVLPETGSDGAAAVTSRIVAAVRAKPFTVGATSQAVTVSGGVASFPDHGRTASEILRAADAALYVAKAAGRDRWCLAEVILPGQEPIVDAGELLADLPAAPPGRSG